MPEPADERGHYMTPNEVAELLEVDASTVRRWINTGYLSAERLPGPVPRYRVKRADAQKLAAQPVQPTTG